LTAQTLKKQSFKCKHCNQDFIDNQPVKLYHVDGNHTNWKPGNLAALHKSCHEPIHHQSALAKTLTLIRNTMRKTSTNFLCAPEEPTFAFRFSSTLATQESKRAGDSRSWGAWGTNP
jgi:transposase-like protein